MVEYIEKQAAVDIVNGWRDQLIPTCGENDEHVKCLETVAEHLESLHAVDVRPAAEILNAVDEAIIFLNNASNQMPYHVYSALYDLIYEICPNCGADMSDYYCVNPIMSHRWYTVKVQGIDKKLYFSGDTSRYQQPSFDSWFHEQDENSCLITFGKVGALYIPKRSILYFTDNGIYKGGDAE